MKSVFFFAALTVCLLACQDSKKENNGSGKEKEKENTPAAQVLTKEGLGQLKIGMTKTDIEALLKQKVTTLHAGDTGDVWADTAKVQYEGMEVSLYFQKLYSEETAKDLELFGLSTSSPLCRTSKGIKVGDDRNDVLSAYENYTMQMGPESVMVNDTTWEMSKTKSYIHVDDEAWDKQISFYLLNKKIVSIEASIQMGE